jgi:aspartyl/glutamyl-tRNA(Asn/Gln) amidotransferase C subunit
MTFTEKDLDNLSTLARIDIENDEKAKMLTDMQAILGYISEINEVTGDIKKEKDETFNVVRDDIVTKDTGSNTDPLLKVAPAVEDGYVKVEQVMK